MSENNGKMVAAFVNAQRSYGAALKSKSNPMLGSKYADLASIFDACQEALNANGFAVTQDIETDGNGVTVTTRLLHESGESMVSKPMTLPVLPMTKRDGTILPVTAQSFGSAITYGRRYQLAAMAGVAPEDDDANAVNQVAPQAAPSQSNVVVMAQINAATTEDELRALFNRLPKVTGAAAGERIALFAKRKSEIQKAAQPAAQPAAQQEQA